MKGDANERSVGDTPVTANATGRLSTRSVTPATFVDAVATPETGTSAASHPTSFSVAVPVAASMWRVTGTVRNATRRPRSRLTATWPVDAVTPAGPNTM